MDIIIWEINRFIYEFWTLIKKLLSRIPKKTVAFRGYVYFDKADDAYFTAYNGIRGIFKPKLSKCFSNRF